MAHARSNSARLPSTAILHVEEMWTFSCLDRIVNGLVSHYSKEILGDLNRNVNQYRSFMAMVGLTSPVMEKVMEFLQEESLRILSQAGFPIAGIKPTSEGIGDGILVVTPATGLRKDLLLLIDGARRLTHDGRDVRIEYASCEHGRTSDGVHILKSSTTKNVKIVPGVVETQRSSVSIRREANSKAVLWDPFYLPCE